MYKKQKMNKDETGFGVEATENIQNLVFLK